MGQLQQRGCKVVLVGDPDQLQPIQAGKPFRDITQNNNAARLTEIRRQKSAWQREASRDLANGHTEMALQTYADQGAVNKSLDRDQAITALVDDYVAIVNRTAQTQPVWQWHIAALTCMQSTKPFEAQEMLRD